MNGEKWKRKSERVTPLEANPETPKIEGALFSEEIMKLKMIMDAKLKCQNRRQHRVGHGEIWMINTGGSQGQSKHDERHRPDVWEVCPICNV